MASYLYWSKVWQFSIFPYMILGKSYLYRSYSSVDDFEYKCIWKCFTWATIAHINVNMRLVISSIWLFSANKQQKVQ